MFRKTGDALQPIQVIDVSDFIEEIDPDLIDTLIECDDETEDSITKESDYDHE